MPKSSKKRRASSRLVCPYHDANSIPWPQLEQVAQGQLAIGAVVSQPLSNQDVDVEVVKSEPLEEIPAKAPENAHASGQLFSDSDRNEIFQSVCEYFEELSIQQSGISAKAVQDARDELLVAARTMWDAAFQYIGASRNEQALDVLEALHQDHSSTEASIHQLLIAVSQASEELAGHLENYQDDVLKCDEYEDDTQRAPKTIALERFIKSVLFDARKVPAKAATGHLSEPDRFNFERWGISIGPRSKQFREFLNAVLRTNFSEDRVRHAFRSVRKTSQTMEEMVEAALRGG